MKKCYITGPMRGIPEYNYPVFMEAATYMRSLGWKVFNPAEMQEIDGEDYRAHTLVDQKLDDGPAKNRLFARRDTDIIINVLKAENGDILVALPDWNKSIGSRAEIGLANWVGLDVVHIQQIKQGDYDVTGEN